MAQFRVIDLRSEIIGATEQIVESASPEDAARSVLGIEVFRSGHKANLVARVYWQRMSGPLNMVRLYSQTAFE